MDIGPDQTVVAVGQFGGKKLEKMGDKFFNVGTTKDGAITVILNITYQFGSFTYTHRACQWDSIQFNNCTASGIYIRNMP